MQHRLARAESDLGGDRHILAARAQRLAEHLLGLAAGVAVGGVEKIDARVERLADHLIRQLGADLGHGGKRSFAGAEGHGAESQSGNH